VSAVLGTVPRVTDTDFAPGRWWRVLAADGSLWCETSDEDEARERMRPGDTLHREFRAVLVEWREIRAP
jgi:hypothetical protein